LANCEQEEVWLHWIVWYKHLQRWKHALVLCYVYVLVLSFVFAGTVTKETYSSSSSPEILLHVRSVSSSLVSSAQIGGCYLSILYNSFLHSVWILLLYFTLHALKAILWSQSKQSLQGDVPIFNFLKYMPHVE